MMKTEKSLQGKFLNALRLQRAPVTVYLVSGIKLQGTITAFDQFCLLLKSNARAPQLVYKHAVSTVAPMVPVEMVSEVDGPTE